MKNAETISINEKKTRFSNAKISDVSRRDRKKLMQIRRMKTPDARNGAYFHFIYKVRIRGMK
jgi:hypothetical protein